MKLRTTTLRTKLARAKRRAGQKPETGLSAKDVILSAAAKPKIGRRPSPPRPYIKERADGTAMFYVKDSEGRRSLNVPVDPNIGDEELLLAVDVAMQAHEERRDSKAYEQADPEDVRLIDIMRRWRESLKSTTSRQVNYNRELYERHLFAHRPEMRLNELTREFGTDYIAKRVAGLAPGLAKDKATSYAIAHLEDFARALAAHNEGVNTDLVRHFIIPDFEREYFAFHLTWDLLVRMLLIASGWKWDKAADAWAKKWDEASGRWVLDFDRSRRDEALIRFICLYTFSGTRDSVIPTLGWAGGSRTEGHIDVEEAIIVRRPPGHARTNKRAEPSYLIGPLPSLTAKWHRLDQLLLCPYVIHDAAGMRIHDLRDSFDAVADAAGIPWVTPHHCKHTGATLYTYAKLPIEDLAEAFSTSASTLKRDYVHLRHLWRKPRERLPKPSDLGLLKMRHVMTQSKVEWLKEAARLKEEKERKDADRAAKSTNIRKETTA